MLGDIARRAFLIATLLCVSGCAFRPEVSHMAVEYNEFVAQATNRQSVINILRARDREPLHFTSFSGVHGSATIEGVASLQAGIVGTAVEKVPDAASTATSQKFIADKKTLGATTWTPNFNVKVDTGTSFDIAINATDDFWKGIMKPLDADTVAYYLQQGWPADLLSYLLVERIDYSAVITMPDGKTKVDYALGTIENSLSTDQASLDIQNAIRCRPLTTHATSQDAQYIELNNLADLRGVSKDALGTVKPAKSVKTEDPVGKPKVKANYGEGKVEREERDLPVRAEVASSSEGSKLALANGLGVRECASLKLSVLTWFKAHVQHDFLSPKLMTAGFMPDELFGEASNANTPSSNQIGPSSSSSPSSLGAGSNKVGFNSEDFCTPIMAPHLKCDLQAKITLRSTEGIIYYLGEYVRHQRVRPELIVPGQASPDDPTKPLLVPIIRIETPTVFRQLLKADLAETRTLPASPFVQVEFKGTPYLVYSSGETLGPIAGRSSEVITLVQQLLNLYRTAKDLPTTQNVRVIN